METLDTTRATLALDLAIAAESLDIGQSISYRLKGYRVSGSVELTCEPDESITCEGYLLIPGTDREAVFCIGWKDGELPIIRFDLATTEIGTMADLYQSGHKAGPEVPQVRGPAMVTMATRDLNVAARTAQWEWLTPALSEPKALARLIAAGVVRKAANGQLSMVY